MDALPTHAEWYAAIGTGFELTAIVDGSDVSDVEFVLVSVSDVHAEGGFLHWRLMFEGPADPRCEQGLVTLRHTTLGRPAVFVVPVAGDAGSTTYEAVFNVAATS